MIALTWNFENEIGHPAAEGPKGGLKPFGRKLLAAMDRYGILPDVSHLNEAGFWEVCERAALPPIASYAVSFAYIGAYWNNHHHTLHAVTMVNGRILYENGEFLVGTDPQALYARVNARLPEIFQ
jgi:membrane dipeptidase